MIKRIIEISREPAHLSVRLEQLIIQPLDAPKDTARSIPCEDIGVVLVDHPQVTFTHAALAMLMQHGAAVVICGRDHLPAGLLTPLSTHTEVVWRVQEQIAAGRPACKRLWQQLIVAKIRAQAANLSETSPVRQRLLNLAREVKSGDTTNIEAQAARLYWPAWLEGCPVPLSSGALPVASPPSAADVLQIAESRLAAHTLATHGTVKPFSRNPDGLDPLNILLNYGYAVLRAAVARALVSAGLFPAIGLHHCNRSNTFALADDLMEPLRPDIDRRVRDLWRKDSTQAQPLEQRNKAYLLDALNQTYRTDEQTGPLMVSLHRSCASLVRCLRGESDQLVLPEPL